MTIIDNKTVPRLDQLLVKFPLFAKLGDVSKRLNQLSIERLGQLYFFHVSEIVLPVGDVGEQDDFRYFSQRFQSVLSALHAMGWSAATIISGTANSVHLYLGFIAHQEISELKINPREIFENLINGLIPGTRARFCKQVSIERLLEGEMRHGGLVAGVPILKSNEEHQKFNLSSIIRSMRGQDYFLMFISRPVTPNALSTKIKEMCDIRDECHKFAKRTRSHSSSASESLNINIQDPPSVKNRVGSALLSTILATAGGRFLASGGAIVGREIGAGLFAEPIKSHGKTSTVNFNENLSWDEQNSVALELEALAERYVERLMTGVNVGAWETIITFVTKTREGRHILAASMNGEITKPSKDMLPPRYIFEDVVPERPLLFPKADDEDLLFSKSLISTLTSEELAHIAMPPVDPFLGYNVSKAPTLGLSLPLPDDEPSMLGNETSALGCICENGEPLKGGNFSLNSGDIAKHVFVCGITGSGKTTTVKALIETCDVPFLVIESAKREYRQLIGSDKFRQTLLVYTIGDDAAPLSMNPFYIMEGVSLFSHIDFLKAIFNAAFGLFDPLPYILEKSIHEAYRKLEWDLETGEYGGASDPAYPTISDLKKQVKKYIEQSKYTGEIAENIQGALVTRLESLSVGAKGRLFNTREKVDIQALLKKPTVLELESLSDDDDKALFIGILLTFLSEYRQLSSDPSKSLGMDSDKNLEHLLVVEEAHRLLKNTATEGDREHHGNPRGKALEFFANVLAEMRSMGQGVIVSEQIPTKLLPDVIKNTNTKIVHRMVAADDQKLVGSSLGLDVDEERYLNTLKTGHALYFSEGMKRPTEIKVSHNSSSLRITNQRVKRQYETLSEIS